MPLTSVQEFLKLIEKSNLLAPEQLAEVRTWPEEEPKTLAARMANAGWITKWQSQQLLVGKSQFFLGRYKLLDLIGQGGMGSVYKAVQPSIGRIVALKVMSKQVLKQRDAVSRFLREIRSAAVLDHPNIVRAFDADHDRDTYFLVMEFVTGQNLKSMITLEHSLPVGWSCECIRQAALGLQHAFEQGMVHRDVKPSNLLVTQNENNDGLPLVKILDLGLARFVSETQEEGDLTRSGQVLGTPDYIAPEQARNTKTADIRADIFSLGCTLFELLTGRLPFPGSNVMEKLMARASHDAPPVRMYRPEVPAELDAVVARMLARDPQFRYGTPADVAVALAPFAMGPAGAIPPPATSNSRPGASIPLPSTFPVAATEVATEANLHGFPADVTEPTAKRAPRSVREPSEIWEQPRVRIAAAILAGVFVLGLIWSLVPRGKGTPAAADGHATRPHKKHKEEAADEPRDPVEANIDEHDPEWAAALWVLEQGGTVTVIAASSHGAQKPKEDAGKNRPMDAERHEVANPNALPAGPFHIVEASLHGNVRVQKADFERLAKLPHLESLSLADTRFADVDLAELQKLESLTRLDLQDTPVTDAGIGYLRSLPNLQSLQLTRTKVSGTALDTLRSMKSLTDLSLEGTRVTDGDLKHLEKMPQLAALNLAGTQVKGPGLASIRRLKELTRLDLGGLPMQRNGLGNLKGLLNIRYLRLTGSRVTDADLAQLSGMTNLKELLLSSTGISGAGLKNLTWMAELEVLDLQDTVVGDDGFNALRELSTLKSLNLQGSVVSDAGIENLRGLRGLEFVDLSGTKVTRQGVDLLKQALPGCKIEF